MRGSRTSPAKQNGVAGLMARWGKDEQGSGARNGRLGRSETERTLRGRRERYVACGDDVSDGVLFSGEKYPKAAGDTGAEGPFQGQTPPFPRTPFGDASGGGGVQLATVFENSCLPVRLFRVVTPLPVQRYPPRLERRCHSLAISMPHGAPARAQRLRRGSCGEKEAQRRERAFP